MPRSTRRTDDGRTRPRATRGREAGPVELDPLLRHPRGGDRRAVLRDVLVEARRARPPPLLRAHGRDDYRLPPLRLSPRVQDEPRVPVRARLLGAGERAEGNALVGGASSQPSQVLGPARGRAQPAARLLLEPPRMDPLPAVRRDGRDQGSLTLPRVTVPQPVPHPAAVSARDGALLHRRLV